MRSLLIGLLSMASLLPIMAQPSSINLEGKVINEKNEPVAYATVLLRHASDSSLVTGTTTNEAGHYFFQSVKSEKYLITSQFVGFTSESIVVELSATTETLQLPIILLKEDSKLLQEVVVLGQRPLIEQEGDKLILNVQNTIIAEGGSAIELLVRAPGVSIDQNDQISLNGKSGVTLMIDGKLTYLPASELATLLRSMNASTIASVEIIANPSARYDAAGNSGIINIKLKKNMWEGFTGSTTVGTGFGTYGKANGSINLHYRTAKWNHFLNYGYTFNRRFVLVEIDRTSVRENETVYFQQYSDRVQNLSASTWQAGSEYQWNTKNSISIGTTGSVNGRNTFSETFTNILSDLSGTADSSLTIDSDQKYAWHNATAALGYKHLFAQAGHELTVDVDYSDYEFELKDVIAVSEFDQEKNLMHNYNVLTHQPSSFTIYAIRADYVKPFSGQHALEAGVKYSHVNTVSNVFYSTNERGYYEPDMVRSNDFDYAEQISAAYLTWKNKIGGFTTQLGLRGEQTHYLGYSKKENQQFERNYFRLFPNLSLNREFHKNYRLGLSYSHRIDRPTYNDLFPFVYFLDPFTGQQGNPLLLPQLTHTLQLSQTIAKEYTLNLGYSNVTQYMAYAIVLNEDRVSGYATRKNLDHYSNYYLNAIAPLRISNRWTINANVNIFYNRFDTELFNESYTIECLSGLANISQTILLPWGLTGEVTAVYAAPNAVGLFQNRAMGSFNVGLVKQLLDKKLSVKLNMTDLFETNRLRNNISYTSFNMNQLMQVETRVVRLNVSYNFGKSIGKPSRRRNAQEDEQRRIGTNG